MKINNIQDLIVDGIRPVVIVTGVSGQDGSHMVDYLIRETNFQIIGGARRLSNENHINLNHLEGNNRFQLVNFDLTDSSSISDLVKKTNPSYFINFAAQSFVASSWDFPIQTHDCNTTGVIYCLNAIRQHAPKCRFYNAGSSEEFGDVQSSPQDETTPLRPRSPYGASKASTRHWVKVYRESYGLYAVQGWLFNHEGVRRGEEFVTRKITKGVARIKKTLDAYHAGPKTEPLNLIPIELGNLDAKRDWSDAEDMVDGVWRMLNQEKFNPNFTFPVTKAKEYVCSSGETHTIREFVEAAFSAAGIEGQWFINLQHDPTSEAYVLVDGYPMGYHLVQINSKFYRPAEVEILHGDSSKIRTELGWNPQTDFKQLVQKMLANDLK
jgi:GDPmannose 4,6-dehydratase